MAMNQLRAAVAALRSAIDFAESSANSQEFLNQRIPGDLGGATAGVWRGREEHEDALRAEVRALLLAVLEQRPFDVDLNVQFELFPKKGEVLFVQRYPTQREAFLHRLIVLLRHAGTDRLMRCPAPAATPDGECGRLFLKVTRKEFCSTRCQARVNMRNQRENAKRRRAAEAAALKAAPKGGRGHGKKTRTR